MNDAVRTLSARKPQEDTRTKSKPRATDAMSRIKLALLEQYSHQGEKHGSDPYNTTVGGASKDQWRGNARRI